MKIRQTRRKKQRGGAGNKSKNNTNTNKNKWRTNISQRVQAILKLALAKKL